MSFTAVVFDIGLDEIVQRYEIWRHDGPSSRASLSNTGIPKSGVKISPDMPKPVWRGSILLEHLVWDVSNRQMRTCAACQVIGPIHVGYVKK